MKRIFFILTIFILLNIQEIEPSDSDFLDRNNIENLVKTSLNSIIPESISVYVDKIISDYQQNGLFGQIKKRDIGSMIYAGKRRK